MFAEAEAKSIIRWQSSH